MAAAACQPAVLDRRSAAVDAGLEVPVTVEAKLDGIAVACRFHGSALQTAGTCGDGHEGEDVAAALVGDRVQGLSLTVSQASSGRWEVHGEPAMTLEQFDAASQCRVDGGRLRRDDAAIDAVAAAWWSRRLHGVAVPARPSG